MVIFLRVVKGHRLIYFFKVINPWIARLVISPRVVKGHRLIYVFMTFNSWIARLLNFLPIAKHCARSPFRMSFQLPLCHLWRILPK